MRRILAFGVLSALLGLPAAHAADVLDKGSYKDEPVYAPALSWTGFYIGVNAGYAFSEETDVDYANNLGGTFATGSVELEGGFAGGQIGYNYQAGQIVFGIEADIQGADLSDEAAATGAGIVAGSDISLGLFGTVRGRIGLAYDRALFYVTGGFAYGQADFDIEAVAPAGPLSASASADETLTGYVVGGGLEYALSSAWSIKAEYQYINLGSIDAEGTVFEADGDPTNITFSSEQDVDFHTVRIGLNYKFGAEGYEPLK
jgi:outer membrane immunogenic protein